MCGAPTQGCGRFAIHERTARMGPHEARVPVNRTALPAKEDELDSRSGSAVLGRFSPGRAP